MTIAWFTEWRDKDRRDRIAVNSAHVFCCVQHPGLDSWDNPIPPRTMIKPADGHAIFVLEPLDDVVAALFPKESQ